MLITLVLALIIRHSNLPYPYPNYPAFYSPLLLPELFGMQNFLILSAIMQHVNLPYSCLIYTASKSNLFLP